MSIISSDSVPPVPENSLAVWQRNTAAQLAQPFASPSSSLEIRIPISQLDDIVKARRSGRLLATQIGCSDSRVALILTAISELGRNIISYASFGEILLSRSNKGLNEAIVVVAKDHGPGIEDVSRVVDRPVGAVGADTGSGGLGLSGLKMCMDHFSIESRPGTGTRVTCEVLAS